MVLHKYQVLADGYFGGERVTAARCDMSVVLLEQMIPKRTSMPSKSHATHITHIAQVSNVPACTYFGWERLTAVTQLDATCQMSCTKSHRASSVE